MKVIKSSQIKNSSVVKIFKNQIFEEIVHDAIFNGQKFIDPENPPDNKIINYLTTFESNIPWNRPSVNIFYIITVTILPFQNSICI
jgi:hypothetical protein